MLRRARIVLALMLAAFSPPGGAVINILACEPEWGALAQVLGGDKVTVSTATTAFQDPHHIQARPSLLARARNADLVVCTGAQLEIGWLPVLLNQAGNPKIQEGRPGYFEAAGFVRMLEIPERVDRSLGDVHPGGNPHIHMDPRNIALVAEALARRLGTLDAANETTYQSHYQAFSARWRQAIAEWERRAAPLKGMRVVVHHKAFVYLERWLGLSEVAALEPKPGIEPSSGHLAQVLAQLQQQPAHAVIRSSYNDRRGSEWLAERAGIPAVQLPFTVGGSERATDLLGFFDDVIQRLLAVADTRASGP